MRRFTQGLRGIGRSLRIWRTVVQLVLLLWLDGSGWTYRGGMTAERREARQHRREVGRQRLGHLDALTRHRVVEPEGGGVEERSFDRQRRTLTAVGRVAASVVQTVSKSAPSCTPSATPIAAATPIAGAPRMIIVLMALATSK